MAIGQILNGMKGLAVRTLLNQAIDAVNNLLAKPDSKVVIDPNEIRNALNRGTAPDSGSLKGLDDGWWVIPEANTNLSGRPSGSKGDLIYLKQSVGKGFAYSLVLGKNAQDKDTMWVSYRDGNAWTSWWPIVNLDQSGSGDIPNAQTLDAEIQAIQQQNSGFAARLTRMETALGKLYSPDKATFDAAVQKLIQHDFDPARLEIDTNRQNIQKLMDEKLTIAAIEKALSDKGWGPAKGGGATTVDLTAINKGLADNSKRLEDIEKARATEAQARTTRLRTITSNTEAINSIKQDVSAIKQDITTLKGHHSGGGGGGDKPQLQLPTIVAMFSNSVPTSITQNQAVTSTTGEVTLLRASVDRSRVFVLVENDNNEASKVTGISVDGGLASVWQPRDLVIDGKSWRAFYSAGAYTETSLRVKVNFE